MWPFVLFHSSFIFYLHFLQVNYNVIYSSCIQYSTFHLGHVMSEHKCHYMMWASIIALNNKISQSNNYIRFVKKAEVMCPLLLLYNPGWAPWFHKDWTVQHCQLLLDITPTWNEHCGHRIKIWLRGTVRRGSKG